VSKDDDFRQLSLLRGAPPKVVVLAVGNGGNAEVLNVLLSNRLRIEAFDANALESFLLLRALRG
jgi:predicted nuclease of predicted toxin-antitoxin system